MGIIEIDPIEAYTTAFTAMCILLAFSVPVLIGALVAEANKYVGGKKNVTGAMADRNAGGDGTGVRDIGVLRAAGVDLRRGAGAKNVEPRRREGREEFHKKSIRHY